MREEIETKDINPFEESYSVEDIETTELENETKAEFTVAKTDAYPYIEAKTGNLIIGTAITLSINEEVSLFGEASENTEFMVVIDSVTKKSIVDEQIFEISNLNSKMKVIPVDVFDNLKNVKKTVTLSRAYKNLQNEKFKKVSGIDLMDDEIKILNRAIKKNKELSTNIISKITENTGDDLEGMLAAYAFKKHLLITGGAGQGKTFIVDKFINDSGASKVMYIAHTGTEAIDLIGHYVKKPDGSFIWKDGTFSKAFRLAQTEQVVYFLDEMLRMPARELNILVGSLTPDSDGNLRLMTDRHVNEVSGIAETEELVVPMENLWVVSTTNQGNGFQSARIDEALKDRFRLFYQKMSIEQVELIVKTKLAKLKASPVMAKQIISLIAKTEEIQATGNIPRAFTIRHLSEAIDTAKNLKDIKKKMIELIPNIVSIDSSGEFNKEQVEIVKSLVKRSL